MAWKELFGTDIGILSLITIGIVLAMGGYYVAYFSKKMNEKPPRT